MKKIILISAICLIPNFLMAAENALLVLQNQEKDSDEDPDYDEYKYDLDGKEIIPLFEADFSDYFKQVKEESENRIYKEVQPYNKKKNTKNTSAISDVDLSIAFAVIFGEKHNNIQVEEQNIQNKENLDNDVNVLEFYSDDESEFNKKNPNYGVGEELFASWLKGMEREGEMEQKYQEKMQKKKQKEIEREKDPRLDLEILFDESQCVVVNKVVDEEQHDENLDYFYTFEGEEKKSDDELDIAIDENDGRNTHRKSMQEHIANLYQSVTHCSVM